MATMKLWSRLLLAALLVLATACNTDKKQEGKTPEGTASTAKATAGGGVGQANPPVVAKAKLKVGDSVMVCWRYRPAGNPFAKNDTKFQCSESAIAIKAPWGDGEGAVHGKLLSAALRKSVPKKAWLHAVAPNKDPREPGSSISLDNSASSYFNNYVGVDASKKNRVYIDVEASTD